MLMLITTMDSFIVDRWWPLIDFRLMIKLESHHPGSGTASISSPRIPSSISSISSPHIFIYLIVSIDSFLILLIFQVFTYALYHFFWLFLNVSMFWMKSSHRGFNRLISATHPISIDILITRLIRKFCNLQKIDIIIIITRAFSEFSDKARVTK